MFHPISLCLCWLVPVKHTLELLDGCFFFSLRLPFRDELFVSNLRIGFSFKVPSNQNS